MLICATLQVVSEIKLEQGELYKDIEKYQEQIATTEETIKGFEEQIAELREAADAAKVLFIYFSFFLRVEGVKSHT